MQNCSERGPVTHAGRGFHGLLPDTGLAAGFEKRKQCWEGGERPVVGKDEDGEVVSTSEAPRELAGCYSVFRGALACFCSLFEYHIRDCSKGPSTTMMLQMLLITTTTIIMVH